MPGLFSRKGGYVLAFAGDDPRLLSAGPGDVLANPSDDPPWFVVEPAIENLRPHRWPCRLLKVSILKPLSVQGHLGSYVRASCIRIEAELDASMLLGEQGGRVAVVIQKSNQLTPEQLRALAAGRHADAAAFAEAVRARARSDPRRYCFRDVNQLPSPIGNAEFIIGTLLYERLRTALGASAFEEDGEDSHLAEPWASAARALCELALVVGAPELMSDADRNVLAQAWRCCGLA